MIGPAYAETDFGVTKITRITERMTLTVRAEIFNIFNHSNFSLPDASIINAGPANVGPNTSYSALGAQITGLVGSGGLPGVARQTQFSLKLVF